MTMTPQVLLPFPTTMIQGVVVVAVVVAMVVVYIGSIFVCSYYVAPGGNFNPKAWRGFPGGNYL